MKNIFDKARKNAPCILFLQDVGVFGSGKYRSNFLKQFDALESKDGVLVIATANDTCKLDESIFNRPFRFDTQYVLNLPDANTRSQFISKKVEEKIGKERLTFDCDQVTDFDGLIKFIVDSTHSWNLGEVQKMFISYLLSVANLTVKARTKEYVASVQGLVDHVNSTIKESTPIDDVNAKPKEDGKTKEAKVMGARKEGRKASVEVDKVNGAKGEAVKDGKAKEENTERVGGKGEEVEEDVVEAVAVKTKDCHV